MSGEVIFDTIGCTLCHTPSFTAANDPLLEDAIRNKVVKPYSDFLLHDAGQAADFIEQGAAEARELKTAPQMGLRTRDPLWHDGRFAKSTARGAARPWTPACSATCRPCRLRSSRS